MRLYTKSFIGLTFALSSLLLSAPAQAAALTSNQVGAILMLLQSFGADQSVISNVQATLTGGSATGTGSSTTAWVASSTAPGQGLPPGQVGKMACIALNRNLSIGSQGQDVKSLQQFLAQDPSSGFSSNATGFFGPLTAKAMMNFQMHNGIASSSTGAVGALTRGFFERRCGQGLGEPGQGQGAPGWPPMPMMGSTTASTTLQHEQDNPNTNHY